MYQKQDCQVEKSSEICEATTGWEERVCVLVNAEKNIEKYTYIYVKYQAVLRKNTCVHVHVHVGNTTPGHTMLAYKVGYNAIW